MFEGGGPGADGAIRGAEHSAAVRDPRGMEEVHTGGPTVGSPFPDAAAFQAQSFFCALGAPCAQGQW